MSKTYEQLYFTTSPKHRSNVKGFTTFSQGEGRVQYKIPETEALKVLQEDAWSTK